jgi:hypothetical protein
LASEAAAHHVIAGACAFLFLTFLLLAFLISIQIARESRPSYPYWQQRKKEATHNSVQAQEQQEEGGE